MGVKTFLAWQRLVFKKRIERLNAQNRAEWEQNNPHGKRGMP